MKTKENSTGYIVPMRVGDNIVYLTETSFDFRCNKCVFNNTNCPTYTYGKITKPLCEVLEYDCFSFVDVHPDL